MTKAQIGDTILVLSKGKETFGEEVDVVDVVEGNTEGFNGYVVTVDESGKRQAIAHNRYEIKKQSSEVIKGKEWVVGKTFIVPRERDNGTMLPFYPVIKVCENGVSFIDDNGFTRNMLFRNVRQVDPIDTHERIIDLASSFAKMKEEYDKKFSKLEQALSS